MKDNPRVEQLIVVCKEGVQPLNYSNAKTVIKVYSLEGELIAESGNTRNFDEDDLIYFANYCQNNNINHITNKDITEWMRERN